MFNLVTGTAQFRREPRNSDTSVTAVYLYDEISYFGVTAADMVAALQGAGDVALHIHSPGGDVFEGIAMLNVLRQHPGAVDVTVDGWAASAASFVAMAGRTVTMSRNAQMMIHNAHALTIGDAAAHMKSAEQLTQANANIADVYVSKAGGDPAGWLAAMNEETWYTAQEAVDAGLADTVGQPAGQPENVWDLSPVAQRPAARAAQPKQATPTRTEFEEFRNALKEAFA